MTTFLFSIPEFTADEIKKIISEAGEGLTPVTQVKFAEMLGGVTPITVSRWVTGSKNPNDPHRRKINEIAERIKAAKTNRKEEGNA